MSAADRPMLPVLIIGGTEKAGTTSVFDWLSVHPEVGASMRKETDFFRHDYEGDPERDRRSYAACFRAGRVGTRMLVEASPGYLGEAATTAPRIARVVPQARLLFILRDPVERLYSSYQFHRARLNLPRELAFDDYVARCLAYDAGTHTPAQLGLDEWYLKVLGFGRYAERIATFRDYLSPGQVRLMFFEALRTDPAGFMAEVSRYCGIDPRPWSGFDFRKSNATFSARDQRVHRLAMRANSLGEPLLRRWPGIKRSVVRAYKALNQEREGYDAMPADVRTVLAAYYAPSVQALRLQADAPSLPTAWHYLACDRVAA